MEVNLPSYLIREAAGDVERRLADDASFMARLLMLTDEERQKEITNTIQRALIRKLKDMRLEAFFGAPFVRQMGEELLQREKLYLDVEIRK